MHILSVGLGCAPGTRFGNLLHLARGRGWPTVMRAFTPCYVRSRAFPSRGTRRCFCFKLPVFITGFGLRVPSLPTPEQSCYALRGGASFCFRSGEHPLWGLCTMLAAARRLGASIILLALVYQGRSVLEGRGGGVSEARRALAAVDMVTDCTSAMQDGCCKSQDSCSSDWQPVCGALPSTPTWRYESGSGEVTTNYTHNYTFLSVPPPPRPEG